MNALAFPRNIRIPSGKTATLSEMKEYGAAIQQFVKETEASLKFEKNAQCHNDTVDYLNHIAQHYNRELQLFHKAEQKRRMTQIYGFIQASTNRQR